MSTVAVVGYCSGLKKKISVFENFKQQICILVVMGFL